MEKDNQQVPTRWHRKWNFSDTNFKAVVIKMLVKAITNTPEMQVKIKSICKETEYIKKNQMKILGLENTIEILKLHLIYSIAEWR